MRNPVLAAALGAAILQSGTLHAQPMLCVELPPPTRTETIDVGLGVWVLDGKGVGRKSYDEAEQTALLAIMSALRSKLAEPRAPRRPTTSSRFAMIDSAESLVIADMNAAVTFTLHADGRISDVVVGRPEHALHADSLLVATLTGWTGGTLAGHSPTLGGAQVRLSLFSSSSRTVGERHPVTWVQVPWFQVQLPLYRGTIASMLPTNVAPRYPTQALRERREGEVLSSFLVKADGSVDRGSITIRNESRPEFGDEVRRWLPNVRFAPATVNGCPVPSAAMLPSKWGPPPRRMP